jgi:putative sugar O-methyltransferase
MNTGGQSSLEERLRDLAALNQKLADTLNLDTLDSKWRNLVQNEPQKLLDKDGRLNWGNLQNFRRLSIFLSDMAPSSDFSHLDIRRWARAFAEQPGRSVGELARELLSGARRGQRDMLRAIWRVIDRDGMTDLMRKYPVGATPGNPYAFRYKDCEFNVRWARHVYLNGLLNRHIGRDIDSRDSFAYADIGCGYGPFSYVFKNEHPRATGVLVDFPEQLLLAYFFLGSIFPDAKFATPDDYGNLSSLDSAFVRKFDFVLLPVTHYERLASGSVDMVANFFSLGEMPRFWFDYYLTSPAFKGAEYFFTSNRIESAPRLEPTYDTDLTILDYPLEEFDKILFEVLPIYPFYTRRKNFFFHERITFSAPNFDFLGRRKGFPAP